MELLDGDAARAACSILPDDVAGATFNPLDAHVEPTLLTQALVRGFERAGGTATFGSRVLGLTR